jgi:hypothetical protein
VPSGPADLAQLPATPLLGAFDGAALVLASLAGAGPTLLFVYKDECPATRVAAAVLPRFAAIAGLSLVAVSQDDPADARDFARRSGWTVDVRTCVDAPPWAASEALGVRVTPTWLLVERDGRVVAWAEGWDRREANGLAALAAGLCGVPTLEVSVEGGAEPPWQPG